MAIKTLRFVLVLFLLSFSGNGLAQDAGVSVDAAVQASEAGEKEESRAKVKALNTEAKTAKTEPKDTAPKKKKSADQLAPTPTSPGPSEDAGNAAKAEVPEDTEETKATALPGDATDAGELELVDARTGVAEPTEPEEAPVEEESTSASEAKDAEPTEFFTPSLDDISSDLEMVYNWYLNGGPARDEDVDAAGKTPFDEKPAPREPKVVEERGAGVYLFMFFLLFICSAVLSSVRTSFVGQGIFSRAIALLNILVRAAMLLFALIALFRVLPGDSRIVFIALASGIALAAGWALRELLADLWARLAISFEHRLAPNMWVAGEGFSGSIESLGLRSATLRDAQGHMVSVPNRDLVRAPVVSDATGNRLAQVAIRLDSYSEVELRPLLRDAVLSSPWIMPGTDVVVLRDPNDPVLWQVEASLLDSSYAQRFRGELVERFESVLGHSRVETTEPSEQEN